MSQSTVSLVLSGKGRGRISARTEVAVRRAAAELGYRPNAAARALRTGAARTVGLVVPDVTQPFFGRVLRGAQAAAWEAGYVVALLDAANDSDWQLASEEALRSGPADGVLLFGVDVPAGAHEHAVVIEGTPGAVPIVRLDVEAGARDAARHLLELGHRRVGHLASAVTESTFALRAAALYATLAAGGAAAPPVARARFETRSAREAALALIDAGCTAVFCDDDILAGGAYVAARERGVALPAALSIVGFDDLHFAELLCPPLTTVAADGERLGAVAFAALAAGLTGEPVPAEQVLPVTLRIRGSTAPPAA